MRWQLLKESVFIEISPHSWNVRSGGDSNHNCTVSLSITRGWTCESSFQCSWNFLNSWWESAILHNNISFFASLPSESSPWDRLMFNSGRWQSRSCTYDSYYGHTSLYLFPLNFRGYCDDLTAKNYRFLLNPFLQIVRDFVFESHHNPHNFSRCLPPVLLLFPPEEQ